jgi:hypothetical protein
MRHIQVVGVGMIGHAMTITFVESFRGKHWFDNEFRIHEGGRNEKTSVGSFWLRMCGGALRGVGFEHDSS